MMISDRSEVHQALNAKAVTLHSKIVSRVPQTDEDGNQYMKRFETPPGRMLLGETLPKSHKVPFETVNRLLTKKEIADVIDVVYRHRSEEHTSELPPLMRNSYADICLKNKTKQHITD